MLKLIKNAEVYSPEYLGSKDVLITAEKIGYLDDHIDIDCGIDITVIDADGMILIPGFIDQHVHIIGGGGEGGYRTRTPEILLSDITRNGVTTVIGCLGTDCTTRSISSLIAKARGLEEEGITSFIYTGSYEVPIRTLTGSIKDDIILIDKIIGVGEIALSDHRSSQPTLEEIKKIAAAARTGGMLSGKAGIVHIHLGDGNSKLSLIEEIVNNTEIPIAQFMPTHIGRNRDLFESSIEYAKRGGLVDFTTSTSAKNLNRRDVKCSKALATLLSNGVPIENISFSSDGQGSLPKFNKKGECVGLQVGNIGSLLNEVRDSIIDEKIPIETAIKVVTSNPARTLKLKNKGGIQVGKDADIVIMNKDFEIDTVIAKGRIMIANKEVIVKGTFET